MGEVQLWIDFTFADDVMRNMSISERAKHSTYIMNRFMTWFHDEYSAHLIWRREWQTRKSGTLKGELVPHYHCMVGGLSPEHKRTYEATAVRMLSQWVFLTQTRNPKAISVALHRDKKTGSPSSYRLVDSVKTAVIYIGKYFSKDSKQVLSDSGESIGRCWGCSRCCPDIRPLTIKLTPEQSARFRLMVVERKKMKPTPYYNGNIRIGTFERQILGYATYIWDSYQDVVDMLVDLHQDIVIDNCEWLAG